MAAFDSFSKFETYFDEILDTLDEFTAPGSVPSKLLEAVGEGSESNSASLSTSLSISGDNPAPRTPGDADEIKVTYSNHYVYRYV